MAKTSSIHGVFLILLLILLVPFEEENRCGKMMMVVEARTCESQSHKFHGTCVRDNNCALVCKNEGFSGGKCRGFQRRCFCTKTCI
ncbi:defensin-like protein 1 [Bidens hawaiensis]|uniref:defensin-like protein 1 n=1 Tax=Bidens hawaiensis TaxID=980011 RepID=UPI004048F8E8